MSDGETANLVLKRMLELFLKVPPLKKILQFQERICFFFLKTRKATSSASVWCGHSKSSFKENVELFLKVPPLNKLEFSNQKKDWNLYEKKISDQNSNQWLKT